MWHRLSAGLLIGIVMTGFSASADALVITYVSSASTTNAGGCDKNSPCSSFRAAYDQTTIGGEIVCLTPGNYGSVTIMKSISINCIPSTGGLSSGGFDSPTIRIDIAPGQADPTRTVRLRGLSLSGIDYTGTAYTRLGLRGIEIVNAAAVHIENSVIAEFVQHGIYDHRTGGQTKLFITDSVIRDNTAAGILAASGATNIVVLDNVRSFNNAYGLAAGSGNNVMINRSVFSANLTAGIEADPGAKVVVNNSSISHNNYGVQVYGSVNLSNNDIAFNNTAITGNAGTFGNNRFSGNVSIGTAPTPLGGASNDLGQQ